jgi:hypothetical protein
VPRTIILRSILAMVCVAGLVLGLALAGFSPVDGDPEMMYQLIKYELARS